MVSYMKKERGWEWDSEGMRKRDKNVLTATASTSVAVARQQLKWNGNCAKMSPLRKTKQMRPNKIWDEMKWMHILCVGYNPCASNISLQYLLAPAIRIVAPSQSTFVVQFRLFWYGENENGNSVCCAHCTQSNPNAGNEHRKKNVLPPSDVRTARLEYNNNKNKELKEIHMVDLVLFDCCSGRHHST